MTTERNADATSEQEAEGHGFRFKGVPEESPRVGDEPEVEGHKMSRFPAAPQEGADNEPEVEGHIRGWGAMKEPSPSEPAPGDAGDEPEVEGH